jgi:hypothetical protein
MGCGLLILNRTIAEIPVPDWKPAEATPLGW